ncbi:MAG: spore photoproduct lyase family protein [Thermodesulfobacteriota bacterium]
MKATTTAPQDPSKRIKALYLEEGCEELPLTREILARSDLTPITISHRDQLPTELLAPLPHSFRAGKRHLLLTRNQGAFFKPCPSTRHYRCCDYQVLNIGMGCPMECVYCILQAYLNSPWLTVFVNIEDLISELDLAFERTSQFWRIGTGEFSDSLALDSLTGLSPYLVKYMAGQAKGVLELKTKSGVIANLENLDHNGRTIVAWSLNAPAIMANEEMHTASLSQRLAAAVQCGQWGYKLAFHFDPIIYHTNWRQGYAATIDQLFATVPAEKIAWISLGALRFLPQLKPTALTRFPGSTFFHEEFIMGLDNKMRYFRSLRVEMYNHILELLRARVAEHTCLYFCMESDEIWQECGFSPGQSQDLPTDLDLACQRC